MTTRSIGLPPRTITARGLHLRPFTRADLPAVGVALRDPQILSWAAGRSVALAPEADRAALWFQARRANWADGTALYAVTDAADGALLGSMALRDIDRLPGQGVLGYWVTPAARGRAVATRALDAVAHWALSPCDADGLALHRLSLDHVLVNTASCKVALKADFQIEGTMRDFYAEPGGRRHDSHLHARLATDSATRPDGYATARI